MSVLRSLESKIAGLVEGTFSRAFRSEVRPVEIARKLAREMEDHRSMSVARTYVPNEYRVYLSPRDRARFADYEHALAGELAGYLLEHARREGLSLLSRPVIDFETDERLRLGEFGIQTRVVAPGDQEPAPARQAPAPARPAPARDPRADIGPTMVYGATPRAREPEEEPARDHARTAVVTVEGRRRVIGPRGATLGRSRQCDIVLGDSNVSRQHAEIRPRGGAWVLSDLGSTNGSTINGREVSGPEVLQSGDRIALGGFEIEFDLE